MVVYKQKTVSYLGYKSGNTLFFTQVNGFSDQEMSYHPYGEHSFSILENLASRVNTLEEGIVYEFLVRTKLRIHHCGLHTFGDVYKVRTPKGNSYKSIDLSISL